MSNEDRKRIVRNTLIANQNAETVSRYGNAAEEFIKGKTGIDHETGTIFNRSHDQIYQYKVNPEYHQQNIQQQAGFSAEIIKVSRDNSRNIIEGSNIRVTRTEDHPNFGSNDQVLDHVETINGKVISNSGSQMKFVSSPEKLIDKIAKGEGGGKNDLSRYRENYLDLPSEQVQQAKQYCNQKAQSLAEQAEHLEKKGKFELAGKKREQAEHYKQVEEKIRDSKITTDEAIFYRKHPDIAVALEMAKVAHEGGIQGLKNGACIGTVVSVVQNLFMIYNGDKEADEAVIDVACDVGKSALLGYSSGFVGTFLKSTLGQSSNPVWRSLSKTNLPAMAVSVGIELYSSISKYVKGDIDTVEFFEELGEKGTSILSSSMFAALGEIAIPIPVVGALLGGMIGYSLSSCFYKEALLSAQQAKIADKNYKLIKAECEERRKIMEEYQIELQERFDSFFGGLKSDIEECFSEMDNALNSYDLNKIDDFIVSSNRLVTMFGGKPKYQNMEEFENFLNSNESFF